MIVQSKTAGNIIDGLTTPLRLNPGYWTYDLGDQGKKDMITFFISMILEFAIGSFFLFMAIKIIKEMIKKSQA